MFWLLINNVNWLCGINLIIWFWFCILYRPHLSVSSSQWLKSAWRDFQVLYCRYKSQSILWLCCMAQYAEGDKPEIYFSQSGAIQWFACVCFHICNNASTSKCVCRKCVTIFEQCLQKTLFTHAFNCLSMFKFALKLEVKQGQQELEDKLCTIILLYDSCRGGVLCCSCKAIFFQISHSLLQSFLWLFGQA